MKESKTTYAYLIEHMQNPSFQKVWDIAYDFIRKLPSELCNELHESLNKGVEVLDSEPMLQMYIYAFGKMHNAKLLHAFNHMHERTLNHDKITIIDWGCGQGLASLCYHDYLGTHNSVQQVIQIVLIEPSSIAISRAELLCSCFYPNAEIIAINKSFDDLTSEDINVSPEALALHFFSNILDVESYNLQHLIQIVANLSTINNEYIIVSPIQNAKRMQRLKTFASNVGGNIYYEKYLDKNQLDEERDWTCAILLSSSTTKNENIESESIQVFEEACSFLKNYNNDSQGEVSIDLLHKLQSCAELGDKRCQNLLGLWYLKGISTEKKYALALEWFQRAAEQDYAPAFGNMGEIYRKGLGVEIDNQKAFRYYKEGADKNHPGCQCLLGECFLIGKGVPSDKNMAFSLFMESSSHSWPPAMYMLYKCYLNGWGTRKDDNVAIKYLKKAVNEKHAVSCYVLGSYYQVGKFVEKNEQKSLKLYRDSAKRGYASAQEKLGDVYRLGLLGIEKSPEKSFNWYYKAAEQGKSSAQFYVGYYYASGYGVKKDVNLAFEWYSKAAEQDSSAALNNLAICYEYGRGTNVDLKKAVLYYEKSAKLGNIKAQKNLAECYKNGTGVDLNSQKVFYWTFEAAKRGDIESMGWISLHYLEGYGTDINHLEALLWYARYYSKDMHISNACDAFNFFKKKADEGDPQALYIVGKCLQYGVATDKSISNSYSCYETAAKFGHIESLIKVRQTSSLNRFCSYKEDKNSFKDAFGIIYSKDQKALIKGAYLEIEEYRITRGTRIICDYAFVSCNFGKIIIPSSVITIGKNPFAGSVWSKCAINNIECYSTQFTVFDFALYTKNRKKLISYFGKASKISIPEGVEIIGSEAFANNDELKEIIFPESLCCIETAAFKYCLYLKQISLPRNVQRIGEQCFYGCESLEEVASLGKVVTISKEAFMGCNIKRLSLPESLVEIEDNAFNSNRNLECLILPSQIRKIANSCFAFCSIKKIVLNDHLQEIGDFCFFECPIESVDIPSNVKSIGLNPFVGTFAIKCKENNKYASKDGLFYDKECGAVISCSGEQKVALCSPISRVNSFAFYNSSVSAVFMGNNIVEIAPWAFYKAQKLENVIWRSSKVTLIPNGCFGECNFSKIDIPSCVEIVQKGAFFDCYDLRRIRFYGKTKANESIFFRIEQPSVLPCSYSSNLVMGSIIGEISDFTTRVVDFSTFPAIEVIVPNGCSKDYTFSPIHDDSSSLRNYSGYNMDRKFIIKEDEKE